MKEGDIIEIKKETIYGTYLQLISVITKVSKDTIENKPIICTCAAKGYEKFFINNLCKSKKKEVFLITDKNTIDKINKLITFQ